MADVRCPMCGKPNPADAAVCQFCQARLKPMLPAEFSQNGSSKAPQPGADRLDSLDNGKGEESPDWLQRVRQRSKSELGHGINFDSTSGSPESEGEVPDWLKDLRESDAQAPSSESQAGDMLADLRGSMTPASEESAETWQGPSQGNDEDVLSRLGEIAGEQTPPAKAEEEVPDWLASLNAAAENPTVGREEAAWMASLNAGPGTPSANAQETPTEPGEVPDWLNSLRDETTPPTAPPAPAATSAGGQEIPDWLNSLSTEPETPPAAPRAASTPKAAQEAPVEPGEVPDWLNSLRDENRPPAEPAEIPDWMASLGGAPAAPSAAPAAETPAEPGEIPDWMASLGGAPAAPSAPAAETPAEPAEIPDWMASLGGAPAAPSAPAAETPAEPAEIPDWMASLGGAPAAPAAPAAETPAEPAEIPDWMASLGGAPAAPSSAPSAETPAEPAEIPDWMASLGGAPAAPSAETPATPETPAQPGEVPDWMASLNAAPAAAEESAAPAAAQAGDIPDWLASLNAAPSAPTAAQEPPAQAGEKGPLSAAPETPVANPLEWGAFPSEEQEAAPIPPFVEGSVPDWLSSVSPQTPEPASTSPFVEEPSAEGNVLPPATAHPFTEEGIPDWLSAENKEEAPGAEKEEAGGSLEKANLPTWLQAMRPVEAVVPTAAPGSEESIIEKSGPLAGLRGVLPGEPGENLLKFRKPPAYSARLQVSESQRGHSTLLESVVAGEAQPRVTRRERTQVPQKVTRLLVGLVLILALLLPLLSGAGPAIPPGLFPVETAALHTAIENLPPDSAVLVAVEYEPGLAGEMRAVAGPVIEHLLAKNARIALVSTHPAGTALGNDLLTSAQLRQPAYSLSERSAQLGLLAGGITSLHELAQQPRLAASGWDAPAVASIQKITDFQQILLLTDDPEAGRSWVEQVGQALQGSGTSLLMVTSAQAGPILQPYYQGKQVSGLLSGLPGAMAYEQLRQQSGNASFYWNSYQSGLILAVALVLLGAAFQAVFLLFPRRKSAKGG